MIFFVLRREYSNPEEVKKRYEIFLEKNSEERIEEVKIIKEKGNRRMQSLADNYNDTEEQCNIKLIAIGALDMQKS